MAVAIGRDVALSGVSCAVSNRRCSPKDWDSLVRVSLPPSSGRPLSWRISGQPSVRWVVRTSRKVAAKYPFVEDDSGELATSNALQVQSVEEGTAGAADTPALLSEFEKLLTQKSQEVTQMNEDATIFLIGMMASGKSTVGRIVADALDYKFFDSDEVIESYVGGLPVKEIFRQQSEAAFRDLETRALEELSRANCLVVATGGGAVVRDDNWASFRDGITVWLDVPVEDLAKRVAAVGTESRPLLGGDSGDFESAFSKLSKLMEERELHYAKAHCRLSLRDLASSLQLTDVGALTPTAIAVQVLEEIRQLLQEGEYIRTPIGY